MKKVLLGTTALLAAGLFAGPALGQARTPMTATNFNLTLGGFAQFDAVYQTAFPGQNYTTLDADGTVADEPRSIFFNFDAELEFRGQVTLPNGTKAGFEFELETGGTELYKNKYCSFTALSGATLRTRADCADYIDDNFMWVQGRYGKVTLGGVGEPGGYAISAPRVYTSGNGISLVDEAGEDLDLAGKNRSSFTNSISVNAGRNRVIYEAPAMSGFRVMLAYAPDLAYENTTVATQQDDVDQAHQDKHIQVQWAGSVFGNRLRASAAWARSEPENRDPAETMVSPNTRWRLGLDYQVGDLTFGMHYRKGMRNAVSVLQDEDVQVWAIGATYSTGVWEFGAGYEKATTEQKGDAAVTAVAAVSPSAGNVGTPAVSAVAANNRGTGQDTANRWDVGINYTGLGSGRTIRLGYRQQDWQDNNNDPDNESKIRSVDLVYDWTVGPGVVFTAGFTNYRYTHHAGLDATDTQTQRTANGVNIRTRFTF
jgi:predicted porin